MLPCARSWYEEIPQASGIETPMHTLVSELRVSRGRKSET